MAERYRVLNGGITANWSDSTKWSATSGGAGGASVPTSADNVHFDANSFLVSTGTVVVDVAAYCLNMDWTGATYSPTFTVNALLKAYGNVTFIAAMVTSGTSEFLFVGSGTQTLTSNGLQLNFILGVAGAGTLSLQDDLNLNAYTDFETGVLTTNGHTINMHSNTFEVSGGSTTVFNLGASQIINCYRWYLQATNTVNAGTSVIKITGNPSDSFYGGGKVYNEVQFNGSSQTIVDTGNTFAKLTAGAGAAQTIKFTDGTTQTVTTPNLSGSAGKIVTLQGTSTAGWTITKAGGGQALLDYVAVAYSQGTPANTWYYGAHGSGDAYSQAHGWASAPSAAAGFISNRGKMLTAGEG